MGYVTDPGTISVLAVDDDPAALEIARLAAGSSGRIRFAEASSAADAFAALEAARYDLVLLDLGLPDRSGPLLLSDILAACGGALVAVVTADDRPATIVECMKRGAFDYLAKPLSPARIRTIIAHVSEIEALRREIRLLRGEETRQDRPPAFDRIITRSPLMLGLFRAVERVAPSPLAALVAGESGVGKELVARAIHDLSGRSGAFVPVNVAGLDDALFADTLFGHVRGAYTGADSARRGLAREAEGGTLFLDEIGDIGLDAQVKLLRFLQDGEYYPLGSDKPERSGARLVMATNADLGARVREGAFRADLYYRLMIHYLSVPPLRERREDIPLLVERFAEAAAKTLGRPAPRRTARFLAALEGWPFPGNVRELFSLVHGAASAATGEELSADYARAYTRKHRLDRAAEPQACPEPAGEFSTASGRFLTLAELADRHIREALRSSGGNQSAAAALLGVSQSTVSRYLKVQTRPMQDG